MEENRAKSAPTGCFKCGRPGHWSRDCPSSAPNPNNPSSSSFPSNPKSIHKAAAATTDAASKPTKRRAPRPKLTPELLLSDDGLGFVLRYFPRSFKYRGRGREVGDLGNLIRLYSEWHSHVLPSYSFDQFVHKAEQVAATKRVKMCIKELRERVARGGDPSKLYEDPIDQNAASDDQDGWGQDPDPVSLSKGGDADAFQEVILNEVYETAIDEPHHEAVQQKEMPGTDVDITEEQRARMEANRLKALERAKGSSTCQEAPRITDEQVARMEANRLKALERAAARAKSAQSA